MAKKMAKISFLCLRWINHADILKILGSSVKAISIIRRYDSDSQEAWSMQSMISVYTISL